MDSLGRSEPLPGKEKVLVAALSQLSPFLDATELKPRGTDQAVVAKALAFGDLGEACHLVRSSAGRIDQVRIGGKHLVSEEVMKSEVQQRYQAGA